MHWQYKKVRCLNARYLVLTLGRREKAYQLALGYHLCRGGGETYAVRIVSKKSESMMRRY